MLTLTASPALVPTKRRAHVKLFTVQGSNFPSFLPKEVENIKDPFARRLATRIERLPVSVILTFTMYLIPSLFAYWFDILLCGYLLVNIMLAGKMAFSYF
jgi:hypothetical protein